MLLSNFASNPLYSKGRLYPEKEISSILSPFEVDRSRIIESKSFRRLEYKTQVFFTHKEDHYRNRLTHSLEAAEITRVISKALNISVDLSETITLAHDLGHAPFGHAGEEALNQVMQEFDGSFNHNVHTLTIITDLEKQYPGFDGLNLSWEVIDGLMKHNGPVVNDKAPSLLSSYARKYDIDLNKFSSLEAQVSSLSDDLAYNNHDIDDGFRAGTITIEELAELNIFGDLIKDIRNEYSKLDDHILLQEAIRRMKDIMILDLINTTRNNIKEFSIETIEDIRNLDRTLAGFSNEIDVYNKEIKTFLMEKVYKHHSVTKLTNKAKRIIKELFYLYMNNLSCLPSFLQKKVDPKKPKENAVIISNFIACMSDRYAIAEYRSFFELSSSYIK